MIDVTKLTQQEKDALSDAIRKKWGAPGEDMDIPESDIEGTCEFSYEDFMSEEELAETLASVRTRLE